MVELTIEIGRAYIILHGLIQYLYHIYRYTIKLKIEKMTRVDWHERQ